MDAGWTGCSRPEMIMTWETLLERREFTLRRSGRYLVAELALPHQVLSTSVVNGGQTDHVRFPAESSELRRRWPSRPPPADCRDRIRRVSRPDLCRNVGVPPEATVMMGTAANMNYAAVATEADDDVEVIAVVTAGVEGNATCAGDPAQLARDRRRHAEGAGARRHDQHDGARHAPAHAWRARARGDDDHGREERRTAAARRAEPSVDWIWRPVPGPTSSASRRRLASAASARRPART